MVYFKIYGVTAWFTNNYNTPIQYLTKKRKPDNEIWSAIRISQKIYFSSKIIQKMRKETSSRPFFIFKNFDQEMFNLDFLRKSLGIVSAPHFESPSYEAPIKLPFVCPCVCFSVRPSVCLPVCLRVLQFGTFLRNGYSFCLILCTMVNNRNI